ncbi:type VII secretion target [Gordonia sp. SL306]|uniref:type VII secretion target n=1 Tax=Gordonia sp. SL306 TaxID=2995145 RepID=UPI00227039F3|nr:type VII secretion target [Gordonia sp. SL306]WAC54790.1 type VII secretion target [Gordonia sp. SL306]
MTDVTVHPDSLTAYARGQQSAAAEIRAHTARRRGEVGELTMTFGVIGAEFLAATAYALDSRAHSLDGVAGRHQSQGERSRAARSRYVDTDARSAATVTSAMTPSAALPDRELRL